MACIRLCPITLFALLFTFYFLCYPLFYNKKEKRKKKKTELVKLSASSVWTRE